MPSTSMLVSQSVEMDHTVGGHPLFNMQRHAESLIYNDLYLWGWVMAPVPVSLVLPTQKEVIRPW